MQQIRGDVNVLEAWKERVQAVRKNAIEGKRALCQEITAGVKTLASSKNVQRNKLAVMAQLREVSNSPVEAWKEAERNQRALQLGAKQLMHVEFAKKSVALKQTETIESCKLAVMQAIRSKQAAHIPAWQEAERAERANVQNARNAVMCEVREATHKLDSTQSMQQMKRAVLADIRRHQQPLEAWREAERIEQASIYDNKRALVLAISNGVSSLENKRSQTDLKDALLREIRAVGKSQVLAWKEAKMQLRTQVLKNKVQLNAQICALTLKN